MNSPCPALQPAALQLSEHLDPHVVMFPADGGQFNHWRHLVAETHYCSLESFYLTLNVGCVDEKKVSISVLVAHIVFVISMEAWCPVRKSFGQLCVISRRINPKEDCND